MTVVELANLALFKLGITQTIASTGDASREAYTLAAVYDHNLRAALRRFPWPFATKYRACREDTSSTTAPPYTLLLAQGPLWDTDPADLTLVQAWSATATYAPRDVVRRSNVNYTCIAASTNNEPPNTTYWTTSAPDFDTINGDWTYAYRWPDDCLFVRRVVPQGGDGRQFNPNPIPFRIGRDENGLLIYTNEQEAEIEYTTLDCVDLWADDLFLDAFTWLLAAKMAASLDRAQKTSLECYQMFEVVIRTAATVAMQEGQQHKDDDLSYLRYR